MFIGIGEAAKQVIDAFQKPTWEIETATPVVTDSKEKDCQTSPGSDPCVIPGLGVTLRDCFAGQALAGMLAGMLADPKVTANFSRVAEACYQAADAMLKARNTK